MKILDQGVKPAAPETITKELCDNNGGILTRFLRIYTVDAAGALTILNDVNTSTGADYTVTGTIEECAEVDTETQYLCEDLGGGATAEFFRVKVFDKTTGNFVRTYDCDTSGSIYTVVDANNVYAPAPKKQTYFLTGAESVAFTDAALAAPATIPAGVDYAVIQVLEGDIAFTLNGNTPSATAGKQLFRCGTMELGCHPNLFGSLSDIQTLQFIGLPGTAGRVEICYYARS